MMCRVRVSVSDALFIHCPRSRWESVTHRLSPRLCLSWEVVTGLAKGLASCPFIMLNSTTHEFPLFAAPTFGMLSGRHGATTGTLAAATLESFSQRSRGRFLCRW